MPRGHLIDPQPTTAELQEQITTLQAWWRTMDQRLAALERLDRRPWWTRRWQAVREWYGRLLA